MGVWENVKLPEGKILIPGVISHATNIVEHPELVAQRIVRYAKFLGRENVIAAPIAASRRDRSTGGCIPRSCGRNWNRWPRAHGWRASSFGMKRGKPHDYS